MIIGIDSGLVVPLQLLLRASGFFVRSTCDRGTRATLLSFRYNKVYLQNCYRYSQT